MAKQLPTINITFRVHEYIRVSSRGQNIQRQEEAFKQFNEANNFPENVIKTYIDKQTGTNMERPALQQLLTDIRQGDLVVIKSLDRLSRKKNDVIKLWQQITEAGADILILDMPILDTRQHKDLLGNFVTDLVLQVLGFVAEQENEFRSQRQAEGIKTAQAKGIKFGRAEITYPDGWEDAIQDYLENKDNHPATRVTATYTMEKLGLKRNTFYKLLNQWKQDNNIQD